MKNLNFEFNAKSLVGALGVLLIFGSIFSVLAWWWVIPGLIFFIFFLAILLL